MTSRQNEIVEVAIKIIARKGIQGLTIKNLASAIKVTEPALYRHFSSKTAILLAILDSFKNYMPDSEAVEKLNGKSSIEKLNFIFENYFTNFVNIPELVSVIFSDEIFKNDKKLSKKIASLINRNEELFYRIIREGQKKKEIRKDVDPKYISVIIMGALRLLVKKWELSSYDFDLVKEGRALFDSVKLIISE